MFKKVHLEKICSCNFCACSRGHKNRKNQVPSMTNNEIKELDRYGEVLKEGVNESHKFGSTGTEEIDKMDESDS